MPSKNTTRPRSPRLAALVVVGAAAVALAAPAGQASFHKTGRFAYLCTVPGHAQAGMKGVFTVH